MFAVHLYSPDFEVLQNSFFNSQNKNCEKKVKKKILSLLLLLKIVYRILFEEFKK